MSTDRALAPHLAWAEFTSPSFADVAQHLAKSSDLVATTRLDTLRVFQHGDLILYLSQSGPGATASRLEVQRPDGCDAYGAGFPHRPDDLWLQFGISPSVALERNGRYLHGVNIDPCPDRGFWLGSPGAASVSFWMMSPIRASLSVREPNELKDGAAVQLGPLLPVATFRITEAGLELEWPITDQLAAVYRGQAISRRALELTACRTLRPALFCQ